MKWYYQHLPGETLDMDEVFERILVDYDDRRSVFTMGKIGVLWEMALETGRFRSAHDLGYQTVADIDPVTGQVTYRDGTIPVIGEEIYWCPSTAGFKSWRAMSYHPGLEAFFIPIHLNCETAVFGPVDRVAGGGGTGPVRRTNHHHPDSGEQLGEFLAMSMRTGEVMWRRRFRTPVNSRRPHHRRRPRHRRRLGPPGVRVRRAHGGDAVGDPAADVDPGVPDHLRGRRPAVPGDTDGKRRGELGRHAAEGPDARGPASTGGNGLFVFALP